MLILSLCDYTGIWSQPYRDAGYIVEQIDLQRGGQDIRLFSPPSGRIQGIIAQPPCTDFAGSGARWWEGKGEEALLEALSISDACLRFVALCSPQWWVMENPVGRLSRFYGEPVMTFNPSEFAGYADDPDAEAYTKRTCLWGQFNKPRPCPVEAILGSKMHKLPPSPERANLRSATPQGFARAFFAANP